MTEDNSEITTQSLSELSANQITGPGVREKLEARIAEGKEFDLVSDLPDSVPFTFSFNGLTLLDEKGKKGNKWMGVNWDKPIPPEYQFGGIYVRMGWQTFKRTGADQGNQWQWEKVDLGKEREERMKAIRPEWEERVYFDDTFYQAEGMNKNMNAKGWTLKSRRDAVTQQLPSGLNEEELTPLTTDYELRSYVIYDPERAEVKKVVWQQAEKGSVEEMKSLGWEMVDSNVARGIFIRTKPEAWDTGKETA